MKHLLAVVAVAGLAGSAWADPILVSHPITTAPIQAYVDGSASGTTDVVQTNYDNWTNPNSALTGVFTSGSDEIADDLHMVAFAGGNILDNMGINCANSTAASNLTGGQIAIRFYDFTTGNFITGFNANLPALSLAAGGSVRLSFGAGALLGLNIGVNQDMWVSLQWNSVTFSGAGTLADCGFQTRGPINIGTSADTMFNVTTASSFNFGGNPLANGGIFINTPAPAGLSLLGLGGLIAGRRRRR